ncbi:MAG: hypothetical protein RLZZ127_829 [Planctomycetota bacterium]|jgi:hypothetical protein
MLPQVLLRQGFSGHHMAFAQVAGHASTPGVGPGVGNGGSVWTGISAC